MPDLDDKEKILEELRHGATLNGPPDALNWGRGFSICRNGLSTGLNVSAETVRSLCAADEIQKVPDENETVYSFKPKAA